MICQTLRFTLAWADGTFFFSARFCSRFEGKTELSAMQPFSCKLVVRQDEVLNPFIRQAHLQTVTSWADCHDIDGFT